MIEYTEELEKASKRIADANYSIKRLAEISPNESQIDQYIYSFEDVIQLYRELEQAINIAEEKNSKEADIEVYEAADDVVCAVKSYFNKVNDMKSYYKEEEKK